MHTDGHKHRLTNRYFGVPLTMNIVGVYIYLCKGFKTNFN